MPESMGVAQLACALHLVADNESFLITRPVLLMEDFYRGGDSWTDPTLQNGSAGTSVSFLDALIITSADRRVDRMAYQQIEPSIHYVRDSDVLEARAPARMASRLSGRQCASYGRWRRRRAGGSGTLALGRGEAG